MSHWKAVNGQQRGVSWDSGAVGGMPFWHSVVLRKAVLSTEHSGREGERSEEGRRPFLHSVGWIGLLTLSTHSYLLSMFLPILQSRKEKICIFETFLHLRFWVGVMSH